MGKAASQFPVTSCQNQRRVRHSAFSDAPSSCSSHAPIVQPPPPARSRGVSYTRNRAPAWPRLRRCTARCVRSSTVATQRCGPLDARVWPVTNEIQSPDALENQIADELRHGGRPTRPAWFPLFGQLIPSFFPGILDASGVRITVSGQTTPEPVE